MVIIPRSRAAKWAAGLLTRTHNTPQPKACSCLTVHTSSSGAHHLLVHTQWTSTSCRAFCETLVGQHGRRLTVYTGFVCDRHEGSVRSNRCQSVLRCALLHNARSYRCYITLLDFQTDLHGLKIQKGSAPHWRNTSLNTSCSEAPLVRSLVMVMLVPRKNPICCVTGVFMTFMFMIKNSLFEPACPAKCVCACAP